MTPMVNKLLEHFTKEPQKTNQQGFSIEKGIKRKGNKSPNGKDMIIHLIAG